MTERPPEQEPRPTAAALRRDRRGNIAVEFAFLAPVLILLSLGTFEMGRLIIEQLRITSAAQAGVRYGAHDLSATTDAEGIAAAARAQVGSSGADLAITSRSFCLCPDQVETACGTVCSGSEATRRYVEVTVSRVVDLFFSYPILAGPFALSSVKSMRIN